MRRLHGEWKFDFFPQHIFKSHVNCQLRRRGKELSHRHFLSSRLKHKPVTTKWTYMSARPDMSKLAHTQGCQSSVNLQISGFFFSDASVQRYRQKCIFRKFSTISGFFDNSDLHPCFYAVCNGLIYQAVW